MKYIITSKKQYVETMVTVYRLMNKRGANLSAGELKNLATIVEAAKKYEDKVLDFRPLKTSQTITD